MRAAFYETNITPPLGGFMWGYYSPHFGEDVDDELFAKAVVIEDNGEIAAIVCVDSCVVPPEMHDIVTKRIEEYTGITPDRVCLSSDHTHKGAPIFDGPELGIFVDEKYKDVCYRLVADAVILAYKRLQDVTVTFDTCKVPGLCFNRNSIMLDGTYQTFISDKTKEIGTVAGTDETYSVITFKADGKPIGIISSYPLHQDSTGSRGRYSGDYASSISDNLKDKYGDDFVSLYLIGTCGDINHIDHDKTKEIDYHYFHRKTGKILADHAIEIIENSKNDCGSGIKVIKELVTFKKRVPDDETIKKQFTQLLESQANPVNFRARNYMHYISTNTTDSVDLYLQCIKIGNTCIHVLPGEIYVNIGLAIKEGSAFENCMVVENSNSYCGYIPTKEAFEEGKNKLYETSLAKHSCLVPESSDIVIKKSIEQSQKLK